MSFVIDTTEFNRAARALGRLKGKSFKEVIDAEAITIMRNAGRGTRSAKTKRVEQIAKAFIAGSRWETTDGYVTRTEGIKNKSTEGRIWFIDTSNGKPKKYLFNGQYRWGNDLWNKIKSNVKEVVSGGKKTQIKAAKTYLMARKKAVGLGKQSFYLIAEKLGDNQPVTGVAGKAMARKGPVDNLTLFVPKANAEIRRYGQDDYILELINKSRSANNRHAKGGVALAKAIARSTKNFYKEIEQEMAKKNKKTLASYPGMKAA